MMGYPNILPIFRRELRYYFNSPVAYVVIIVFLLYTGRKKDDDHVSDTWVQQDKQKGGRHDL